MVFIMVFPETFSEGTPGPAAMPSLLCACWAQMPLMSCTMCRWMRTNRRVPPQNVSSTTCRRKKFPPLWGITPTNRCSRCALCLWIFLFTISVFIVLCNLALSLYMTYLQGHHNKELQTLTERLDAQSQILRQITANQNIALYNPGGL